MDFRIREQHKNFWLEQSFQDRYGTRNPVVLAVQLGVGDEGVRPKSLRPPCPPHTAWCPSSVLVFLLAWRCACLHLLAKDTSLAPLRLHHTQTPPLQWQRSTSAASMPGMAAPRAEVKSPRGILASVPHTPSPILKQHRSRVHPLLCPALPPAPHPVHCCSSADQLQLP